MPVLIIKSTKAGLYYKKIKRLLEKNSVKVVVTNWKLRNLRQAIVRSRLNGRNTIVYARTGGYQVSRNLRWLETLGYNVIPSSKSVALTSNKYLSYLIAKDGLVKSPETRLFLKKDHLGIQSSIKYFGKVYIKSPLGRGNGKNCFYVDTATPVAKLKKLLNKMDGQYVMVQKYIEFERLVRVCVIDGKVEIGSITYKLSKGKHKTKMEDDVFLYNAETNNLVTLSKKIAKLFQSKICIIDFFQTEIGNIYFNEVNNASGFTKQDKLIPIPIYKTIVQYLASRMGIQVI